MSLPECVTRLLPDDLPLVAVRARTALTVRGVITTPIFKTPDDVIAICDTRKQILPPLEFPEGRVWYSIDRIEAALKIARRLGIAQIFFSYTANNGKIIAPLSIVGKNATIAIVVAPNIAPSDDEDEWEDEAEAREMARVDAMIAAAERNDETAYDGARSDHSDLELGLGGGGV